MAPYKKRRCKKAAIFKSRRPSLGPTQWQLHLRFSGPGGGGGAQESPSVEEPLRMWHCALAAKEQGNPARKESVLSITAPACLPLWATTSLPQLNPQPCSSHPALTQLLPTAYCIPNDWRAPLFLCPKSASKCAHNTCPRKSQTHLTNCPELLQSLPFVSLNFSTSPLS